MKTTFKLGDQVRLKSGGPVMTISRKGQYGAEWECVWFDPPNRAPHENARPREFGRAWIGEAALAPVSRGETRYGKP